MARARQKAYSDKSVLDAALDRIRYLYQCFDNIEVSFSGGKDSTCVLNLALKVAREIGRLPVVANFFDEEAIHPTTIEYVQRISENPDIDLKWYALEFKHRNACSNEEPYWYCWDKSKVDLWVRPMHDRAITSHPKFHKGMSFQEFNDLLPDIRKGTTANLTGVRTQESFRRMKAVSTKANDNYISRSGHIATAHPIYDWSSQDVWKLVHEWGIDYNKTYDIFNKTSFYGRFLAQRVCPPFGEEPLRMLWLFAECFPEMWHKMLARVPGVATAWRYSNTELYGIGNLEKPDGITYREWLDIIVDTYEFDVKKDVKKNVAAIISRHYQKTDTAISDEEIHPLTGTSWKFVCKIAIKGDLKGRTAPTLENNAIIAQKKLGINSYKEAVLKFGSEDYKKKFFTKKTKA